MKIYVASSWRNQFQPEVVKKLRELGYEVYDFKDSDGFNWKQIDPNWVNWTVGEYLKALEHPLAVNGFRRDMDALLSCDVCIMVQPCGCSAFMETGWAVGNGLKVAVYVPETREPDLMIAMADLYTDDWEKIVEWVTSVQEEW